MIVNLRKPPLLNPGDFHYITERKRNEETNKTEYVRTGMVLRCVHCLVNNIKLGFKETDEPQYNLSGTESLPTISPGFTCTACETAFVLEDGELTEAEE